MGQVKDSARKDGFTPSSFLLNGVHLATLSACPRETRAGRRGIEQVQGAICERKRESKDNEKLQWGNFKQHSKKRQGSLSSSKWPLYPIYSI